MTKETFADWLSEQPYYVPETEYERAKEEHNIEVTLPVGITVLWEDEEQKIPARDIRHGEWEEQ